MSNYHVMQVSDKKDTATVAFHITVPDEDNAVSVNLRTALKQHLDGIDSSERVVSQVPWLETDFAAEFTAIQNGGVYEHLITVEFDANLTIAQKRTVLDSRYTALAGAIPDILRERFKFWGLNRDVT